MRSEREHHAQAGAVPSLDLCAIGWRRHAAYYLKADIPHPLALMLFMHGSRIKDLHSSLPDLELPLEVEGKMKVYGRKAGIAKTVRIRWTTFIFTLFLLAATNIISIAEVNAWRQARTLPQGCKIHQQQPRKSHILSASTLESPSTSNYSSKPAQLYFYNSLSRNKDKFQPLQPDKVSLYTCGPTIYDSAHVGNFRAFLTYDLLKRALQYFGYNVDHVCNLTDVDDKIIKRCNELNVSLQELTAKYETLFMEDLQALNIVPARAYPRATQHIPEMVQLIKDLKANGLAYQSAEGSWYFNIAKKEGYGQQLVTIDVENMQEGASGAGSQRETDADEYDADKVGARDFALWKAFKPNFDREDATWDTEIGLGRPGWHLECSAMARKFLGETIDLHCGGVDLKFPHHENEIAQSEVRLLSCSGRI